MTKIEETEYGIKYEVIKINDAMYVLSPIGLIEGYSVGETFFAKELHKILTDKQSLEEKELIDSIVNVESLKTIYECDDIDLIREYYLLEEKDYLILIEIKGKNIIRRKINVSQLVKNEGQEVYERQKELPAVTLNCDALDDLLNTISAQEMKEKLEKYRKLIHKFRENEKKDGITQLRVKNGHVTEINMNRKIAGISTGTIPTNAPKPILPKDISDFTINGLETYIKQRVFGHDEVIRKIATTLIMNYRSTPEFGTESILLVGPTGTGKTETINATTEYLNLPFVKVNTANLVPQGIKGPTLEDQLYALLIASEYDIERAQKGIIALDEFDKIGKDSLDIKETVKQIFLKFIEGDTFTIDKASGEYRFNTRMLNKTFSGAFQELFESRNNLGFVATSTDLTFTPSKITSAEYFGKELVTRMDHVYAYYPLSKEEQRRVILESKISKLLQKKKRYETEFGIELITLDSYIDAILEQLSQKDKSMRDLNNIILKTLSAVEYELLANEGKVKRLVLSADTVQNPQFFDLH